MIIDNHTIYKIFNLDKKISNDEDKIKLSNYDKLIPMYDIYTQQIYPIENLDVHNKIIKYDYRFITSELINWFEILYGKYLERDINIANIFKKNLLILKNYDIDNLTKTSYQILFKYSDDYGMNITICKRNSFHPFITYLKPYYTKYELIKLNLNMNTIVDAQHVENDLINKDKYHIICKLISNNDVDIADIIQHTNIISESKTICDIVFYSFIGSSIFNNILRNGKEMNKFYYNMIMNIIGTIRKTPKLKKEYYLYRFINDDGFLDYLNEGDIFIDKGFMSCTRNPFYEPGLEQVFGIILMKINLNTNMEGICLFIEHFSLFHKEEEVLLPPNLKLRLINKNENFVYHHVNTTFEKLIKKKYEFEIIDVDYSWTKECNIDEDDINEMEYNMDALTRRQLIRSIIPNKFNQLLIDGLVFNMYYYDSTRSYSHYYYNRVEMGLSLIYFDENRYPVIFIELGKEMAVNYIHKYWNYSKKTTKDKILIKILLKIGHIFHYKIARIYNNYLNFKNEESNNKIYQEFHLYDDTFYRLIKTNEKRFDDIFVKQTNIINYEPNIFKEFPFYKGENIKELLFRIVEEYWMYYDRFINLVKYDNYCTLNIEESLIAQGIINTYISHDDFTDELHENIYNRNIRRML